jgi:hypothetical protein
MQCPFCDGDVVPTVDIGVGEQQCGPAFCVDCGATQDMEDPMIWIRGTK